MLRAIAGVLFFVALVLFLIFWQQNYKGFIEPITIQYDIFFARMDPVQLPFYVLLILSFIAGVVLTFLLELMGWLKMRSRLAGQSKTIKRMERELQQLRTLPFSDTGESSTAAPEE